MSIFEEEKCNQKENFSTSRLSFPFLDWVCVGTGIHASRGQEGGYNSK